MRNKQKNRGGRGWRIAIGGLFLLFGLAMAVTVYLSATKGSRVTDPHYYTKGLHYSASNQRTGQTGGWRMRVSAAAGELLLEVRDADGSPIAGGRAIFGMEGGGEVAFTEMGDGRYRTARPPTSGVPLRGAVRFQRGDTVLEEKVILID